MKYEDTLMDPNMRRWWVERLSGLTVTDLIRIHLGRLNSLRSLCRAGVRIDHPEWDDELVEAEVARRAWRLDFLGTFNEHFRYVRELEVEVLGA